mmetsp:Transcript_4714/g.10629  ORF Transcript_4714/g.10629 Transcript_4714/m.10629 type:complete len:195 (-) Transcript_4714:1081-1665(-)
MNEIDATLFSWASSSFSLAKNSSDPPAFLSTTPQGVEGTIFGFTIRDSRRLMPTSLPRDIHIFDYVDPYSQQQKRDAQQRLYLDGWPIKTQGMEDSVVVAHPCRLYDVPCYKGRILQVFDLMLNNLPPSTKTADAYGSHSIVKNKNETLPTPVYYDHFFYMESDNELCVTMKEIADFLSVGVGASGWIMSRQFV